jgi:phosphotransferase system  glucose/maltose/N-acetylglucosamine-specific IIC component
MHFTQSNDLMLRSSHVFIIIKGLAAYIFFFIDDFFISSKNHQLPSTTHKSIYDKKKKIPTKIKKKKINKSGDKIKKCV